MCGATDNASDYGSEDSRFESWHARHFFYIVVYSLYKRELQYITRTQISVDCIPSRTISNRNTIKKVKNPLKNDRQRSEIKQKKVDRHYILTCQHMLHRYITSIHCVSS